MYKLILQKIQLSDIWDMPFVCVENILCVVRLRRGMLFAVILTSLVGEALFYVELDEDVFLEGLEPWRF